MQSVASSHAFLLLCMIDCFASLTDFLRKKCSFATYASIYIALLLFGQVFFSTIAYKLGLENRLVMLLFRAAIAFWGLFVILRAFFANKRQLFEAFPLSLTVFWSLYFVGLLRDHFVFGVATALPVWEFFAWGIGGCFLPSLACYLLVGNSDRGQYPASIVCLGFLLLGSSTALFAFSPGLDFHRFQLPSLNPINASHSFFVLSLFSISCLANRQSSLAKSLCSAGVAAFGVSMGIYAGSRGALLAFVCAFLVIFFVSKFNKLWALVPLLFSAYLLIQFDPSDLVGRLSTAGSDLNSVSRLSAIHESVSVFLAHPFLGAGFGYHLDLSAAVGYPQMWYPHNFIFESLALGGLFLTIPLLACFVLAIRSCIGFLGHSSMSELWRIAILVQATGYVAFSGHLANVPLFWIALALASSLDPQRLAKTNT